MLAKQCQQAGRDSAGSYPLRDFASKRLKPFASGPDLELMSELLQLYSTVTLLAKLRG